MQQIMFIEGMKPMEEIQFTNREGKPDVLAKQEFVLSDGINQIVAETVGNYAKAASQLKLKEGGWVQVSLEFSVQDRTTKEGKAFKSQSVKITNIAPLWGHEETEPETF
jgi:hypothetical protein